MKQLYILSLCSLITFQASAQNILFQDDFESYNSYVFGSKWVSNPSWRPGVMYLVTGSADTACLCNENHNNIANRRVAGLSDCAKSYMLPANFQKNPNEWLQTSPVNMASISKACLRFESYFRKGNYLGTHENASVLISVNGGVNWTLLQDVPRNKTIAAMETLYIDLSAYTGNTDVRIAFRFMDNNIQNGGWAIDNVMVFEPSAKDLSLIHITPETAKYGYVAVNTGYYHEYVIQNMGTDTVHSFMACYQQQGKPVQTDTVKNVSIPPFGYYIHKHTTADTVSNIGSNAVKAWISLQGDGNTNNDSISTILTGVSFLPKKMVVVEEGTGTWHYLSPRGHWMMKQLSLENIDVCQLAVHDTDPMSIEAYNDYLYNRTQLFIPYFLIDRYKDVPHDSLLAIVKKETTAFGYAQLYASSYTYNDKLTVDVKVTPAVDMTGDYRVQLVLTEDGVKGTGSGWEQKNGFANNAKGPMGGYENKPDPVPAADMVYNYVVRSIHPSPEGKTNLPATLINNRTYNASFDVPLKPEWYKTNMHAHVLLLRHYDSTILNAARAPFKLSVSNTLYNSRLYANLYPNPATDKTTLAFYTDNDNIISITISDVSGRVIQTIPATTYKTGRQQITLSTATYNAGIYFISLTGDGKKETIKMQVLH